MTKAGFVETLKKAGYKAVEGDSCPTVFVKEAKDISSTWKNVKLLATKVGYNHSFAVKKEETGVTETKVVDFPEEDDGNKAVQ